MLFGHFSGIFTKKFNCLLYPILMMAFFPVAHFILGRPLEFIKPKVDFLIRLSKKLYGFLAMFF